MAIHFFEVGTCLKGSSPHSPSVTFFFVACCSSSGGGSSSASGDDDGGSNDNNYAFHTCLTRAGFR